MNGAAWEELVVGSKPEPLVLGPLSRTDFVRYQGASGDMNPIHHDELVARAAGYPAPLAVGMFHAGAMAAHAAAWLGPENVRRTRIRWSEQAWPGDVLTITGEVTRTYEEGGERRADVEMVCTRQTGGIAVRGWMTFGWT
ncbi:MAG TPA: MaoC/PaaZ C-terminal domain-containing protein [Polyangiaceae bacterium]